MVQALKDTGASKEGEQIKSQTRISMCYGRGAWGSKEPNSMYPFSRISSLKIILANVYEVLKYERNFSWSFTCYMFFNFHIYLMK